MSDDDLRELVESWRDSAHDAQTSGRMNDAQILGSCADELEAVIEE